MPAPYYIGDTVPIAVQITDTFGDSSVASGLLDVYDAAELQVVTDQVMTLANGNELSHVILAANLLTAGIYDAYVTATLADSQVRTHLINFTILTRPS